MAEKISNAWAPHGAALQAYWNGNKDAAIAIHMDDSSITEMPIEIYFRTEDDFPELEKIALGFCKGSILDVGAGAGAHSLSLQKKGFEILGLDVVPEATEIMKAQGIEKVICSDFLSFNPDHPFDTLLFLMNGIGIAGNLEGLAHYLQHAHSLTHEKSQIILDSSDLRYGELELDPNATYFGEINYQLSFEGKIGKPYQWLYVNQEKLTEVSAANGWHCEIIYEQEDGSYLALLQK